MTRVTRSVDRQDVERIVQQIVDAFRPQKVILFGSHAYGVPDAESDVDLLVVMDTDDPLHTAGLISSAIDHPFPIDILVLRPRDLEQSLDESSVFARQVSTEGRVLYEASDDRVAQPR
ncbi:MAG: nucleotidyltransferase domain-containing protein [Anaerolineae bacterium]